VDVPVSGRALRWTMEMTARLAAYPFALAAGATACTETSGASGAGAASCEHGLDCGGVSCCESILVPWRQTPKK
jgi:hypothetical protein